MQAFSLTCTTCKAQLKVRDARLVGQILPCPKCGSMVLVEAPGSETVSDVGQTEGLPPGSASPKIDSPSTDAGNAVGPTAREWRGPGAARDGTWSDSFDHIDDLLEDPTPRKKPSDPQRWRQSDSPVGDELAGEAVAPVNTVSSEVGEAERAVPAESETADWLGAKTSLARSYIMIGGGVTLGVAMAVGVVGWIVAGGASKPSAIPAPIVQATEDEFEGRPEQATLSELANSDQLVDAELVEIADPDPSVPQEVNAKDRLGQGTELAAATDDETPDELEKSTEAESDASPPDEIPPTETDDEIGDAVVDAVSQAAPGIGENPEEKSAAPAPPPPNDELANFARWLQNTESVANEPSVSQGSDAAVASLPEPTPNSEPAVMAPPSTRTPPPPVDVESHLLDSVSAIQLKAVPLHRALRLLSQLSTIPITLDTDAIARLNLQADVEVAALQQNVTVGELLDEILEPLGLGTRSENGQLIVVTRIEASGEQMTVPHRVADLCDNDPARVEHLAKWITQLIEYGRWERQTADGDEQHDAAGGELSETEAPDSPSHVGKCQIDGMNVVVTHSDTIQFKVLALTERLRIARGMNPSKRIIKDRVSLVPRYRLFTRWDEPVTVRIWRERSMDEIASILEDQLGIQILIDWSALYEAGWSPQDGLRLFAESLPLRDVLRLWLEDNGLAYRAVDSQTLEVTTVAAMLANPEIEFYSLRELKIPPEDASRVSEYLANQLGRMRFQPDGNAAIAYDSVSQHLIIAASQPEQIRIAELLESWAGGAR